MKLNDIKDIAIVGSGVIGYSWALSFAMNGHPVHVYDINDGSLKLAKERIHESLVNLAQNKVINPNKIEKIEKRIDYSTSIKKTVEKSKFIALFVKCYFIINIMFNIHIHFYWSIYSCNALS